MAGAIVLVIGDIRKLATEMIQFGLGRILVNPQMISVVDAAHWTTIRVTLNKLAQEGSDMLRAGMFSESEGAGELE
jgi:hypothetical protein